MLCWQLSIYQEINLPWNKHILSIARFIMGAASSKKSFIFFICIRKFKAFSNAHFMRKKCIFLRKKCMHLGKNTWLKELKFSNTYKRIAIEMLLKLKSSIENACIILKNMQFFSKICIFFSKNVQCLKLSYT